jgi:CDGSH-type Zn-finger protein
VSATIKTRARGPLVVEGDFELYDGNGEQIDLGGSKRVKLCRCGGSRTRPLCDGSHYRLPFEAEEEEGD